MKTAINHLLGAMFSMVLTCSTISAQTIGTISPNQSFTNNTGQKLYYLPQSKINTCLDLKTQSEFDSIRIEKYKELTENYQQRIALADSAGQVKNLEAEFWRQKLLSNDLQLEEQRKEVLQLNNKVQDVKRSRMYFFVAGILTSSIAIIALN